MRRFSPFVLAAALYLILSCALLWPLVLHLGTRVANDLGDPLLNMWIFAWNTRTLPLTDHWWNQPQFYPLQGVTAFSEHLLGLWPLTGPVLLATGNPVLAYNLAVFLSYPLAALAGHALGWTLTGRHGAALVAGLAFGFAPYRAAQLAHVQVLSSYWMPLALVGLIQYFRHRRFYWLLLFAGAWLMQALTCGYYLFYLSVLIALWLVWFVVGREPWKDLARVIGVWMAAIALMAPIIYGYVRFQRAYGFRRWPKEIASFSADVAGLLKASGDLIFWGWLKVTERAESDLFPGLTLVVLIVLGGILGWRAAAAGHPRLRAARVLVVLAIVFLLIASTPVLFGDWKLQIFGVKLLSVGTPHKPLSVGLLLLAIAGALSPIVRGVWARRSPFAFFVLAAIAMWLFSLGPAPTLLGKPVLYKAPYTWLMYVPGVEGVRVPARFWMLAVLCLAAAAALALSRLYGRWPRARVALTTAACVGIFADGLHRPLAMPAPPDRSPNRTSAASRLDLPLSHGHDLKALFWGITHRRPLINGYSGYFAPHYWVMRQLVEQGDHDVLTHLAQFGDIEVVVDLAEEGAESVRRYVESHPSAERAFADERRVHFRIRKSPTLLPQSRMEGATLPIMAMSASVGADLLPRMTDGNLISRWEAHRSQRPGDNLTIDLGTPRQVRGVELALGGYVTDFPRRLLIETSSDRVRWEHAWSGSGGGPTLTGALLDPGVIPLTFQFAPRTARYIRLTQLGSDPVFYWSVAELKVFGS